MIGSFNTTPHNYSEAMTESTEILEPCTAKDIKPEGLHGRMDEVIDKLIDMPQVPCPVIHRFSPGLYIREIHLPAGAFAIGHEQKFEHFNVMLSGHVMMVNIDGSTTEFIAPQSYSGAPGRKAGYIVEDTVWQNIYPTDETDIDKLEATYLNKSKDYVLNQAMKQAAAEAEHAPDRFSYHRMLVEWGVTEAYVREMSENELDQIGMPFNVHPYRIANSPIEGRGYFLTVGAKAGTVLAPARYDEMRTPAGRYVNHGCNPNAVMKRGVDGNLYLVAIADIDGCMGGSVGTEVTTDYGDTLSLLTAERDNGEKLCHQQ